MSAILCHDATFIAIAVACNISSHTTFVSTKTSSSEATDLLRANESALNDRYGTPTTERAIFVTQRMVDVVQRMKPTDVIAAIRDYSSQASDWSGWRGSEARDVCDAAMKTMVDKMAMNSGIDLDEVYGVHADAI